MYWGQMIPPNEHTTAFLSAVSPLNHLATFDWLLQRAGPDEGDPLSHAYIRRALLEAAGRREEALAGYRTLQSHFDQNSGGTLANVTQKAVVRLTATR
jgi:hypothetical protein